MHAETGSGFFVEPDKIVTTLENLAGAVAVAAIPGDRITKAVSSRSTGLLVDSIPPRLVRMQRSVLKGLPRLMPKTTL